MTDTVKKTEIFPADYTREEQAEIEENWHRAVSSFPGKVIALDDDPTGVQCVHDVYVYTDWSQNSINQGFEENNRLFFLLTNSRAFSEKKTEEVHKEIAERICHASEQYHVPFLLLSRADSTLRGHYPLETDTLRDTIEKRMGYAIDGEILCPYFKDGGRFTINDIHYVQYGDALVPCGETEFAKDETFGYHSSNLKEYIEEKTAGKYKKEDVISISLSMLRKQEYEKITGLLLHLPAHTRMIVNACDDHDLMVFTACMYKAMAQGKHFLIRCGAPFARICGGIETIALLSREELHVSSHKGGLIMAGSHTAKTTAQLNALRDLGIEFLEMDCNGNLSEQADQLASTASEKIQSGKTVCIYTSRKVISLPTDTKEQALARSVEISDALQSIVRKLTASPAWVIAKGGITSSDIGVKALGVKKALVMGQIEPGVPVWKTDPTSLFPSIPYIIFPGNVGSEMTLKDAVMKLSNQ